MDCLLSYQLFVNKRISLYYHYCLLTNKILHYITYYIITLHAYDHVNYARHFTYCWSSQQKLAEKHPSIYEEFQKGNFCCKRVEGNFNMLPPDQVIEQTVNNNNHWVQHDRRYKTTLGTDKSFDGHYFIRPQEKS